MKKNTPKSGIFRFPRFGGLGVLRAILKKEFKQIFRDKAILRVIFMVPVIQLLILPFAADFEIKNINVSVIDHDHSSYSRALIQKLEYSNYFNLVGYSDSYKKSLKQIEQETADLIIEIPQKFEKDLIRESETSVFLAVNAVDGVKGNLGAAYAAGIIREFNQKVRAEWLNGISENVPLINVTSSNWYNPTNNYQRFMVPGILALLLTLIGCFLAALNIVREKEIGTIEQLNVSPITKTQFVLGKLIPFWVLAMFLVTIGLGICYFIYGITPGKNIGLLYGFAALYLICIMGFGLIISNFADTQQQAMMIGFFFILIFILLSGLYTPVESMPFWAQKVAWINPVTYMVDVMRMILLKSANFSDMTFHFKAIATGAVILNSVAIWTYRKRN